MFATSLISLLLLGLAGVLLDAHRREWAEADEASTEPAGYAFARSRYRRRRFATATIAVVGGLIAVWPLVPREPLWVLGFTALLAGLALQIFLLGLLDAWATSRFYRMASQREAAENLARLRDTLREASHAAEPPADAEAIRA